MSTKDIYALSDIAALAQATIQANFKGIDPIVGINRNLRKSGFAVDLMTIDCLKTGKRITFMMHDETPGEVQYQFGYRDAPPGNDFKKISIEKVTPTIICNWISEYFAK